MARFRGFEARREMRDAGTIRPDDNNYKQNGGNSSLEQQQEIEREANQVGGFYEDIDFEQDNLDNEKSEPEIEENNIEFEPPTYEETEKMLRACRNMQREFDVNYYIGSQAKKLGIDKEKLKLYLRQQEKSRINSSDKVLHYHRTSMESAKKILESGYLLNRANIKLNGGDISNLSGSSSVNVQFTVDEYDEHGQLQMSGFNSDRESVVGAASTDIVFVMSPKLLKEDSYDCFDKYPTVEKANIRECCATILAKNPEVLEQLQSILEENQIEIPTMLQEEFDRESILDNLTTEKQEETEIQQEDDEIQRITNSDIERKLSEVDMDELDVITLRYYLAEKLPQVYGDRLGKAGINIEAFLDVEKLKLEHFEGVETYKEIIGELEDMLEFAESIRNEETKEIEQKNTTIEESSQEETEKVTDNSFLSAIKGQVVTDNEEYAKNVEELPKEQDEKALNKGIMKKDEI